MVFVLNKNRKTQYSISVRFEQLDEFLEKIFALGFKPVDSYVERRLADIRRWTGLYNGMSFTLEGGKIINVYGSFIDYETINDVFKAGDDVVGSTISYIESKNPDKHYFSLENLQDSGDVNAYANNSVLHGKIMEDGYIYNPYIHRRFLPSQYLNEFVGVADYAKKLSVNYAVHYTVEETRKLDFLRNHDIETYRERSVFFNFDVVKETMTCFLEEVLRQVGHNARLYVCGACGYKKNQRLRAEDRRKLIDKLKYVIAKITKSNKYFEMLKAWDCLEIKYIYPAKICNDYPMFRTAYEAAGAYYTIKHVVMFEDYIPNGFNTKQEVLKTMEDILYSDKTLEEKKNVFAEKCKEYIGSVI